MLKRKIETSLEAWKEKKDKLPLIVKGARQVGKTYSILEFARKNYERIYNINFFEDPAYSELFEGSLTSESILSRMSLKFPSFEIIPQKTLLFFDEIQFCPNARTALKFLSANKDIDIISSGSLLGHDYAMVRSIPVGYTETLEMYSLDFEEFLWAMGINEEIMREIRKSFSSRNPIDSMVHNSLIELLREYIVVGGMPAVVSQFVLEKNYSKVRSMQKDIVQAYIEDIQKYAEGAERTKARACFLSIPRQLGKDYKKFQYSVVETGGTGRKFGSSLLWLYDAGIVSFCNNLSRLEFPLSGFSIDNEFKVYMRDTGLFVSMLDEGADRDILNGSLGIYKGAIYENIIADMLVKAGHRLFYFAPSSTLEIDFVIRFEEKVCPVEVKSADNTKAKSLSVILNNPKYGVEKAIKLSSKNFSESTSVITIPLYAAFLL